VELGLFDKNKKEKPVLKEVKKFSEWFKSLDFELPKAREDAVCIVTDGQDQWGTAYMSYLLSKQAKVNLKFAYGTQKIPMSDIYMLPSVNSMRMMPSYQFDELKKRVYDGATLYISNNDSVISQFKELTGVIINDSRTTCDYGEFSLNDKKLIYSRNRIYTITEQTAQVICRDENGVPLITVCEYGKGKVYYVNFPVETMLLDMSNVHETDLFEIYRVVFAEKINSHIADSDCKYIGITEHIEDANNAYIVLINYSDKKVDINLKIKSEYSISKVICGDIESIAPFEITIIKVSRR
jgi:hypothetical protein